MESLWRLWFEDESRLLSQDAFAPPVRPKEPPGMQRGVESRVPRKKDAGKRISDRDALGAEGKGRRTL